MMASSVAYGGVLNPELGIVLLSLELELEVEQQDLGVGDLLGLLLEASVREALLESHTLDQERVLRYSTNKRDT
jgi:hypothetical protein